MVSQYAAIALRAIEKNDVIEKEDRKLGWRHKVRGLGRKGQKEHRLDVVVPSGVIEQTQVATRSTHHVAAAYSYRLFDGVRVNEINVIVGVYAARIRQSEVVGSLE